MIKLRRLVRMAPLSVRGTTGCTVAESVGIAVLGLGGREGLRINPARTGELSMT